MQGCAHAFLRGQKVLAGCDQLRLNAGRKFRQEKGSGETARVQARGMRSDTMEGLLRKPSASVPMNLYLFSGMKVQDKMRWNGKVSSEKSRNFQFKPFLIPKNG
jgi:hypothetical protein